MLGKQRDISYAILYREGVFPFHLPVAYDHIPDIGVVHPDPVGRQDLRHLLVDHLFIDHVLVKHHKPAVDPGL